MTPLTRTLSPRGGEELCRPLPQRGRGIVQTPPPEGERNCADPSPRGGEELCRPLSHSVGEGLGVRGFSQA